MYAGVNLYLRLTVRVDGDIAVGILDTEQVRGGKGDSLVEIALDLLACHGGRRPHPDEQYSSGTGAVFSSHFSLTCHSLTTPAESSASPDRAMPAGSVDTGCNDCSRRSPSGRRLRYRAAPISRGKHPPADRATARTGARRAWRGDRWNANRPTPPVPLRGAHRRSETHAPGA